MITENSRLTDTAQIREILENWATAIRSKDSRGLTSNVAPDVVLFDLINPLQYVGSKAQQKRADDWLSSFQDSIGYETRDVSIVTGDDVAFCHSLNHVTGTTNPG